MVCQYVVILLWSSVVDRMVPDICYPYSSVRLHFRIIPILNWHNLGRSLQHGSMPTDERKNAILLNYFRSFWASIQVACRIMENRSSYLEAFCAKKLFYVNTFIRHHETWHRTLRKTQWCCPKMYVCRADKTDFFSRFFFLNSLTLRIRVEIENMLFIASWFML